MTNALRVPSDRTAVSLKLGATATEDGVHFALFTTTAKTVAVRVHDGGASTTFTLDETAPNLFEKEIPGLGAGTLYDFVLDGSPYPDPYARFLPRGVHGPARVEPRVSPAPRGFAPPPFERWVIYELHIGTFTPEGTYRAAIGRLDHLVSLGVNAIEIMPVASFAGERGWGYDGVALYAPFAGYGDPADLRDLVREAHARGIAVMLDVVYNHFGPSGNYLHAYSPDYFTSEHKTAWGDSPAYGEPHMRRLVLDNARYWLEELDFDGLRLDATHGIVDDSSPHVLAEIAAIAHAMDPPRVVVAEDDRNDPALVERFGLDGVWADDFHHAVRVTLTGERDGYYAAYSGGAAELARVIDRGWLYEGQTYPPRGKRATLPKERLVYCIQNHDQIGNRALGGRLTSDVSLDAFAAAAVLLFFLPAVPLIFMGQEWAASTPFLFFTDHDAELGAAITRGRRDEFAAFAAFRDPELRRQIPDPQAASTFMRSKLDWSEKDRGEHARILDLHRRLVALRMRDPVLSARGELRARAEGDLLVVTRSSAAGSRTLLFSASDAPIREARLRAADVLLASAPIDGDALPPRAAVILRCLSG